LLKKRYQGGIPYEAICLDMCDTKYGEVGTTWRLFWVVDEDTDELEEVPTEELQPMTERGLLNFNHFCRVYIHSHFQEA